MINANSNKKKEKMIKRGLRLKECRLEKKLSQADLAEILDCSNNHISMIERGERNLTYDNAKIISKHLNVSVDYLMNNTNYKTDTERLVVSEKLQSQNKDIFRRFLGIKFDVTIWFKDIDDLDTINYLNSQCISFHSDDTPSSQTCIVTFNDGTSKIYEINYITIINPKDNKLHIIDKDTYKELQEDIDYYIQHSIMKLSIINERKRKVINKSNITKNFYNEYVNIDSSDITDKY